MTTPDLAQQVADDRLRLARSTRALIEAVAAVGADRDDAAVVTAIDAIETATRVLASADHGDAPERFERAYADYLPSSLLVGRAHPLSPEGTYRFADGVLEVTVTFGPAYEGPPGYVHGGVVALAFDELFGMCNVCNGQGGLTGRLSIRYRKPTPLGRPLRMTAWQDHREGRRMRVRGTIHAGDALTAEAEGLFVRPRADTSREYFGDRAGRGPR